MFVLVLQVNFGGFLNRILYDVVDDGLYDYMLILNATLQCIFSIFKGNVEYNSYRPNTVHRNKTFLRKYATNILKAFHKFNVNIDTSTSV